MAAQAETAPKPAPQEAHTFESLLARVPEAVRSAQSEAAISHEAQTPEGAYTLSYLLAARNIFRPALRDLTHIDTDLLQPVGGPEYNPQRAIDLIGGMIAHHLTDKAAELPNFWLRIEESATWQRMSGSAPSVQEGERFAVIDPLDMTSSIPKNHRAQTTGVALYDRTGVLLSAGIVSLVDDGFVFLEKRGDGYHVFPESLRAQQNNQTLSKPLKIATLTRRMHTLKDTPLLAGSHGQWTLDCTSGYAVLALLQGHIDAVVDPFKGNPWYENVIWYAVAQALGYPVTDKDGAPIDFSRAMQSATQQETGGDQRIPSVVSRSPQVQARVLELLKTSPPSPHPKI